MFSPNNAIEQTTASRSIRAPALLASLAIACSASLVVLSGTLFGQNYLSLANHHIAVDTDLIGAFAVWDGEHYVRIASEGYSYDWRHASNVAFFPAYPLAGRFIAHFTGWRVDVALLIASYVFLIGGFALAAIYVAERSSAGAPDGDRETALPVSNVGNNFTNGVLLTFAFFPTTFYFRMAYTESLFVFQVILTLYGIKRDWPICALAAVIGSATATRAAGVALILPLVWHIWGRSGTWLAFAAKSIVAAPVSCWGLAAYMAFLYVTFGDALAFAQTQKHWDQRPPLPIAEKLWVDLTLEPLYCEYDPSCECYLRHKDREPSPFFSGYSLNPVYFLIFLGLLAFGSVQGWLTREEMLAGWALLLFSYFSKGYSTCMCSQARYASVVFPVYIVMGRILALLPGSAVALIVGVWGFFLGVYAALFTRWYGFY